VQTLLIASQKKKIWNGFLDLLLDGQLRTNKQLLMLSECFIASTLASAKTPASASLRDVGICLHELQPSATLRSTFKKSSTAPNCLAVSASHIFAAQSEKATVHVYSRDKGNQEATVPFHERIRSLAVAGSKNGDIVVLGTEGGRLILWEASTLLRYV
jgi:pre-rRNA-processing protein IPI3